MILMPESLTAENGAKALLSGEFAEKIEVYNQDFCDCGECEHCESGDGMEDVFIEEVPVSWTTIKKIYQLIVANRYNLTEDE